SLMDFLSVGISLNLTKKAVQPKTTLTRFTGLILIDGIVVLATLIGVALIIPVFIISFNNILSVSSALQFDWLSQAKIARDFPFTSGLTITLMLFSTLVPTFIHLVFSVFAFSFLPLGRNQILKILNKPESDNRQYAIIALWYTLAWPISCVITLCIFILIFHYLIPNIPIAETLYNLIIWIYPIALT
nr:hypothetical protein [Deltaproteobacteria bacterium]